MGCCTKTFLFGINFIVFLAGGVLITLASLVIAENQAYGVLLGDGVVTIPIIVLILGVIILFLGFFGCCGAAKENSCLLNTYAVIITVLLLAQGIAAILIFTKGDSFFEKVIKDPMEKSLEQYGQPDRDDVTKTWDVLQFDVECCGVSNYTDWTPILGSGTVPDTCCKEVIEGCGKSFSLDGIHTKGCYAHLREDFDSKEVAWAALGLAILQIVCVFCACTVAKRSRHEYV